MSKKEVKQILDMKYGQRVQTRKLVLQATDGPIGHVEDFLADLRKWNIHHLIVDTRNWLPGKEVLVACSDIAEVNWKTGRVYLSITKEAVENSPVYSET